MSLEKTELRLHVIDEIGKDLALQLRAQEIALARQEGVAAGFQQGATSVGDLFTHVDKDITEGKLDLEQAKLVKLWITRAHAALGNLHQQSSNHLFITKGKIEATKVSLDALQKKVDAERGKLQQMLRPVLVSEPVTNDEAPESPTEKPAERVGPVSLKTRRIQEDLQEQTAVSQASVPSTAPTSIKSRKQKRLPV